MLVLMGSDHRGNSSGERYNVAAEACRQRGRIVLIGVTGLHLRRDLFIKKISFQVSCSYGPGRYDPFTKMKVMTILLVSSVDSKTKFHSRLKCFDLVLLYTSTCFS